MRGPTVLVLALLLGASDARFVSSSVVDRNSPSVMLAQQRGPTSLDAQALPSRAEKKVSLEKTAEAAEISQKTTKTAIFNRGIRAERSHKVSSDERVLQSGQSMPAMVPHGPVTRLLDNSAGMRAPGSSGMRPPGPLHKDPPRGAPRGPAQRDSAGMRPPGPLQPLHKDPPRGPAQQGAARERPVSRTEHMEHFMSQPMPPPAHGRDPAAIIPKSALHLGLALGPQGLKDTEAQVQGEEAKSEAKPNISPKSATHLGVSSSEEHDKQEPESKAEGRAAEGKAAEGKLKKLGSLVAEMVKPEELLASKGARQEARQEARKADKVEATPARKLPCVIHKGEVECSHEVDRKLSAASSLGGRFGDRARPIEPASKGGRQGSLFVGGDEATYFPSKEHPISEQPLVAEGSEQRAGLDDLKHEPDDKPKEISSVASLVTEGKPVRFAVADAAVAGTGSGPDGAFTVGDWYAAVDADEQACAADAEAQCGEARPEPRGLALRGLNLGGKKPLGKAGNRRALLEAPGPMGMYEGGPLGFGPATDECLRSSVPLLVLDPECRQALARTQAIYRDLKSRGLEPHPEAMGDLLLLGLVLGALAVLALGLKVVLKGGRGKHRVGHVLEAASKHPRLKAALEEASGVPLPPPGWKREVHRVLEANPELKAAVERINQDPEADIQLEKTSPEANKAKKQPHPGAECARVVLTSLALLIVLGVAFSTLACLLAPQNASADSDNNEFDLGGLVFSVVTFGALVALFQGLSYCCGCAQAKVETSTEADKTAWTPLPGASVVVVSEPTPTKAAPPPLPWKPERTEVM